MLLWLLIASCDSDFAYCICTMRSHLQPAWVSVASIKAEIEVRIVMREVWGFFLKIST